ncbi:uncharacterized protein LOC128272494 [Anopheles cruzii]|uniref:uncharacterized protein LOC128272494 n=1 Tax=Anopheles cruzii TaxID=68878 RepID=UPI0022EC73E5|nr:uncharacterized protein LOC128272494 [Anopheles cruzii]
MASLKDWDVLRLSTLITNINAKLSASIKTDQEYQLLCLVRQNDQILFRYIDQRGEVHLMLLCWFAENRKQIQDVCFDGTGCWLLVFCYDNTLHIVPALSICDKSLEHVDTTFNRDEITSFIVPFIGPHECPNPQTCPNNSHNSQQQQASTSHRSSIASEAGSLKESAISMAAVGSGGSPSSEPNLIFDAPTIKKSSSSYTTHKIDEIFSLNSIYRKLFLEQLDKAREEQQANRSISANGTDTPIAMKTIEDFFADASQLKDAADGSKASTPLETYTISSSIASTVSASCPYPTCCSWWRTLASEPRAILGYSDGSICVVALTPNCPFLGNTNCERGSIEKLIICQDNSMETISLMINTSTKEQWKLLLEQKSIKYTFPGEITPTSGPELRSELLRSLADGGSSESGSGVPFEDWQIVLSLPKDGDPGAVGAGGGTTQQQRPTPANNDGESSGSSPNSSEPASGDDFEKVESESLPEAAEKVNGSVAVTSGTLPKLLPAAKARLQSLRDLGAKKIGTLKLKLSESRIKAKEREKFKEQAANLAVMELPGMYPEILTTPAGPYFVVQYLEGKYLLSALHSYSDTLSVHSMDISLIPLHIYKLPKQCHSTMLTRNVLYVLHSLQPEESTPAAPTEERELEDGKEKVDSLEENSSASSSSSSDGAPPNAVSVVSCRIASMKMGDDCDFNEHSLLGVFHFPEERVLDIHRLCGDAPGRSDGCETANEPPSGEADTSRQPTAGVSQGEQRSFFQKSPAANYLRIQKGLRMERKLDTSEAQVMVSEFPSIEFDQALIVTDRNLYAVELADSGRSLFLSLAHRCIWAACEDFCTTFGLPLATCIEYAGDVLLRRKRISEALMTYNVARLSPMKTALKLALANESKALMKLCAMALRNTHIIGSQFLMHDIMRLLVDEAHLGNVVYDSLINLNCRTSLQPINTGAQCSDFSYDNDDALLDVQISPSDQFHLSNLMFLTLCERCAQDKNYIPLWNFIVTNSKYHTSLGCIMLAHSKLFSTSVLLAMTRGTCLDVFSCLVGTWEQTAAETPPTAAETNAFMYNLSNELFMECLIYLQDFTVNYFELIRKQLEVFDINVLERLVRQLNPFHPVYRPLLHRLSNHESTAQEPSGRHLLFFCKALIETFLAVAIRAQQLKVHHDGGSFLNALKHVRVRHEERAVEMNLQQFSPIATGFFHVATVVRHAVFVWGSNGVNCALSRTSLQGDTIGPNGFPPEVSFLRQIDLDVLAAQCGRLHTLFLTSNGLYAMGSNNLGQLGIGSHVINALQPMLVKSLDGKNITHFAAGQYHNAVVANGLLYTWGWGVFGQLGHGKVDDSSKPKVLEFFRNKIILQLALGHAHTLVLCRDHCDARSTLYVFGSNHYGQLGLGQEDPFGTTVDTRNGKSFLISLVPRQVQLDEEIALINTNLFVNLILTTCNKLYTWGASPQALRLATQAKKRAKSNKSGSGFSKFSSMLRSTPPPSASSGDRKSSQTIEEEPEPPERNCSAQDAEASEQVPETAENPNSSSASEQLEDESVAGQSGVSVPEIKITDESTPSADGDKQSEVDDKVPPGDDALEHLFPSLVDTSLVEGNIVKVSSGLYHFALVTADGALYTWGKNIERQLGREGGRNEVLIPTRLETIDNVRYVECGADFTIVMTGNYGVKAWGNNNMGQCAKEISLDRTGVPGKLVRLPISNRVVRIPDKSQFIETPHDVRLPVNAGLGYGEPMRFLKSMPKFRRSFVVKSSLEKLISNNLSTISSSLNDVSQAEVDDLLVELPETVTEGRLHAGGSTMSSLQSVSYATSPTSLALDDDDDDDEENDDDDGDEEDEEQDENGEHKAMEVTDGSTDSSRLFTERHLLGNDFIHYCLYLFYGLYSQEGVLDLIKRSNEYHIRMTLLSYDYVEGFRLILELLSSSLSSSASPTSIARQTQNMVKIFEYFTKDTSIVPMEVGNIKYFIYELFMFFIRHNLTVTVLEEFFLRNLDCYLVPLASVLYFHNTNNLVSPRSANSAGATVDAEVLALERKLLDKFNNNNNVLLAGGSLGGEEGLRLPGGGPSVARKLENTDTICGALSTSFNVTICQKLLEHFDHCK